MVRARRVIRLGGREHELHPDWLANLRRVRWLDEDGHTRLLKNTHTAFAGIGEAPTEEARRSRARRVKLMAADYFIQELGAYAPHEENVAHTMLKQWARERGGDAKRMKEMHEATGDEFARLMASPEFTECLVKRLRKHGILRED